MPVTDSFPKLNYSAQRLKEKTYDLLLEWLREQSQRHPILFVIEDLHWIDPTTLELLERAVENGQHESQLIILSCRPEFQPPWKNPNHLTQIALTRLTKRQIGELMQAKVGLKSVPPNIVDQIVERTDGVPLFVEEFTQMIVESGRLKHVNGEAELSVNFDIEEIPSTLQDLLMARLDRLESDEEIVQQAAAIGRDFSLELLQAITHMDEHSLELELAKLVQADLLSQRGRPPRIAYQFKHGLLRDAAYQSLVKKKRQEFHLRIGNALEEKFPETCETEPEILAQHFAQAGAAEKAIDYFERAGQRSLERSAHKEAIRHLTQGIELIDTLPKTRERNLQEIHLHISLGVPLQATRGYSAPEVEANYARARELCEMIDDDSEQFPILYGLFRFNMLRAKYAEASELAERVVSLAPPENLGFIVAAHRAVASPLVYQGMHDAALPHLRKVISIEPTLELRTASYRYDVVDPWITSQMYLAWTLWMLGYPDQALEQSRQSVAAARELRHPFSVALALNFSEWLFQFCGDVVQANKTVVEALELSHKHGFAFWFGWSKVIGGWVKAQQAPSESCVAEIREGIKEWRAQGSELGCHYFLVLLAEVCAQAGKISDALEALSDAEEFAKATGEGFMLSEIPRLRGEFLLHKKRIESAEAEVYFRDAIKIARDQESRSLELRAAMSLGRVLVNQSKSAEAIRVVEPLYEWFTEGFETYDLKQAKRLLASWK